MNILYRDQNLIVLVKPPGMASQQDRGLDEDMVSWLRNHLNVRYVGVVHRLNRPVGGVMVYALNKKSAAALSGQVRSRTVEKTYEAAVCGMPARAQGELRDYLLEDRRTNVTKAVPADTPKAREAVLRYECIASLRQDDRFWSLLRIQLMTGRRHQIRVQLAHAGFGIAGDRKYNAGASALPGYKGLALFASGLTFAHPATGERMAFHVHPDFETLFGRESFPADPTQKEDRTDFD